VDQFFNIAELDDNGDVTYSAWHEATEKRNALSKKNLKEAFVLFDKDGDGKVSADELKETLGVGKKFGKDSYWMEVISEVDTDNDGEISQEEFLKVMEKMTADDQSSTID